jgi:hypothetical protein
MYADMLEFILAVFFVVVFTVVYCEVLTMPEMILGWWDKFLHDHIRSEWLLKPLGDCLYCFGGQVALWSFLFVFKDSYTVLNHLLFIITVIFILHIYNGIKEIAIR